LDIRFKAGDERALELPIVTNLAAADESILIDIGDAAVR
jgi:hypothetical protein